MRTKSIFWLFAATSGFLIGGRVAAAAAAAPAEAGDGGEEAGFFPHHKPPASFGIPPAEKPVSSEFFQRRIQGHAATVDIHHMTDALLQRLSWQDLKVSIRESGRTRLYSMPGAHHDFVVQYNEDNGLNATYELGLFSGHKALRLTLDVLAIFDGHGRGGREVSAACVQALQQKLLANLGNWLAAPVLLEPPLESPDWHSSRQAMQQSILRQVESDVVRFQPKRTMYAGATATLVTVLRRQGEKRFPSAIVLSTNLGDSRALAMTFRQQNDGGGWSVERVVELTTEDNVRESAARQEIHERLLKSGWATLGSEEQQKNYREMYIPRAFAEILRARTAEFSPADGSWTIHALPGMLTTIQALETQLKTPFKALQVVEGYLFGWDSSQPTPAGLQLSATIGDTELAPAKRNYQAVEESTVAVLQSSPGAVTVIVAASDGLWDYGRGNSRVEKSRWMAGEVAKEFGEIDRLLEYHSGDLSQFVSARLAGIAYSGGLGDDCTTAVSVYKEMAIVADAPRR